MQASELISGVCIKALARYFVASKIVLWKHLPCSRKYLAGAYLGITYNRSSLKRKGMHVEESIYLFVNA